jgi:hypothetical protein
VTDKQKENPSKKVEEENENTKETDDDEQLHLQNYKTDL